MGVVSWLPSRPCHACARQCRGRVESMHQPYRGRVERTSCAYRRPPPGHDTIFISQHRPCRRPCRVRCCVCRSAPAPCSRALGAVSQPVSPPYCDKKAAPSHNTIFVSRLPHQPSRERACCRTPLRTGRPYRGPSLPYRRAVWQACSAISWPLLHTQPSLPSPMP